MKRFSISLLLALVLISCNAGNPQPAIAPATGAPVSTLAPADTTAPPTVTPTTSPTLTPTSAPPTATWTPEPRGYGPDNFPADVNPLTGRKVADPKMLDRRPLGIKINIVPRTSNRPPFGMSFADIVYDYYHNGGYSRYHAIFYGEDAELVGPIRSGRLPDDLFIRMYKSIFVYGGADSRIDARFYDAPYSSRLIRGGFDAPPCPPTSANPMCTFEPNGRHNLLGSMTGLREEAARKGIDSTRQNLDGMTFHPTPPAGGKPGSQLFVRYSGDNYNRWDYDAATGRYLLFQDDVFDQGQGEKYAPLVDQVNNQQIGADNVVILVVPHEYFVRPPGEIVEILLNDGSGPAYAFRDGQMYEVTWNRPTNDSVLYLTFPDGSRYSYKPGKTWYQVIGKSSEIKPLESGAMSFHFVFP